MLQQYSPYEPPWLPERGEGTPAEVGVFIETPEPERKTFMTSTKQNIDVKVLEPFRIVHEGVVYTGGDTIPGVWHDPSDQLDTTETWLREKWVEIVPEKPTPAATKGKS